MQNTYRITHCKPQADYQLELTFADGVQGVVRLDHLVGKGVFAQWKDPRAFERVSIDPIAATVCWGDDIDLDPVTLRESLI